MEKQENENLYHYLYREFKEHEKESHIIACKAKGKDCKVCQDICSIKEEVQE